MLVDHGIYFDDLEAQHAAVVGDDFHRQMSFAIGRAAADRGADAGGVFGVDPIHVERDVIAGGAASGHTQRFFHYRSHATLVDVAHGEDADAGAADILFFDGVDVADADQNAVFGMDFGREVEDVGKFGRANAEQRG